MSNNQETPMNENTQTEGISSACDGGLCVLSAMAKAEVLLPRRTIRDAVLSKSLSHCPESA